MHSGYLPIYRLLPFLVEPGRVLLLRSDQQNRRERFMTHAGRILGIASVLLHLAVASAAQAQSCPHQGLASFGPISAATFGYPAYYVDQNGQGLGQCLDPANPLCGLPPLPDPAAPLDIATGNFFDENLYTFVTADVPMPPNGQPGVPIGLVVYSVLGTFGGPAAAVVPGDQVTFSRIRFRVDTPAASRRTSGPSSGRRPRSAATASSTPASSATTATRSTATAARPLASSNRPERPARARPRASPPPRVTAPGCAAAAPPPWRRAT